MVAETGSLAAARAELWNLSIQRQLTSSLVLDLGYNGVVGSAPAVRLSRTTTSFRSRTRSSYGNAQLASASTIRRRQRRSRRSEFGLPYANFVKDFGNNATLAQALRPFPQYTDINTWDGNGDHSGHSSIMRRVIKLEKRYASGLSFTTFVRVLEAADGFRQLLDHGQSSRGRPV